MFGKKPFLRKLEWLTTVVSLLIVMDDVAHSKQKSVDLKSPGKPEKNHSRSIAAENPPAGESQAELMLRTVKTEDPAFLKQNQNKQGDEKNRKKIRVEKATSLNYGRPGFTD